MLTIRTIVLYSFCLVVLLFESILGNPQPVLADTLTPIRVVTTTSDLKSLVEFVGGDRVSVKSIALPAQDPHTFEPRLSNLKDLKEAQLVVKIGLDHDIWIDRLLQEVGNPTLQKGGAGYVDTSIGIPLLEVRSRAITPTDGHNHGAGNPHYWLDPANAELMTGSILEGLERIDSDSANLYEANRNAFLTQLQDKLANWQHQIAPYQGIPIITYHNSWAYLARRFRLNIIDAIEPKPGIPPSPNHLAKLIREIKEQQVPLVIREPYESDRVPHLLRQKTGTKTVLLVSSVNAIPQIADYFSLFDYNVGTLVDALKTS